MVRSAWAIVLGVVLALQPTAALADVLTHHDAVGDVARSPVGSNVYTPVPTQVEGDILATRVVHARRAFWIQIRLRELTPTTQGNFHLISIESRWRVRTIEIDAFPGHWEGRAVTTNATGAVVPCDVLHRIDYDRNRVMLRVPRECMGKPPWVRVGIRSTVAGATWAYADDARATGLGPLVYGRRVLL